eukprot:CAMPEP_0184346720 /NCGR_PEP_ID=MMETSP1089-20130417/14929_1 /TAXON_ID=38269 ORGANISM="Gloeochaete wittrockiana, Strain SAG46.84" /NCGR_SAMPLE_ID=MMETSP1089 /ASSEMBLY_ACC=CAM_ASM_000445 /LENGTH=181 /DNA_ID=CAMNT_0026677501 /DNA_START=102 /DNA_END=643 /DNA_ORIENTATION=+
MSGLIRVFSTGPVFLFLVVRGFSFAVFLAVLLLDEVVDDEDDPEYDVENDDDDDPKSNEEVPPPGMFIVVRALPDTKEDRHTRKDWCQVSQHVVCPVREDGVFAGGSPDKGSELTKGRDEDGQTDSDDTQDSMRIMKVFFAFSSDGLDGKDEGADDDEGTDVLDDHVETEPPAEQETLAEL